MTCRLCSLNWHIYCGWTLLILGDGLLPLWVKAPIKSFQKNDLGSAITMNCELNLYYTIVHHNIKL